jgi:hypothetical protein
VGRRGEGRRCEGRDRWMVCCEEETYGREKGVVGCRSVWAMQAGRRDVGLDVDGRVRWVMREDGEDWDWVYRSPRC